MNRTTCGSAHMAAQCSRSSSVCPRSLKRSVVIVGIVNADFAGPKLVMSDAIKRIGLLCSRLISVRVTRVAVAYRRPCACEDSQQLLTARLLGPLRLGLLEFFSQVDFLQAFQILNNGLVLRVLCRFNVRQKVDELRALLR